MSDILGQTNINDEALAAFLSGIPWPRDEADAIAAQTLQGGVSNVTVLLTCGAERLVVKQARPKLDVSMDWQVDVRRLGVEAAAMSLLRDELGGGSIPVMVRYDSAAGLMAMEAADEDSPNWKNDMLAGRLDLDAVRGFGTLLGRIHSIALEKVRMALPKETFFDSLRLDPYYVAAAQRQDAQVASKLKELVDATRRRAVCFVHGDYSPKNVLLRDGKLLLLDYEVGHVGDPGFDLGFAMTHFVGKALHVGKMRHAFVRAAGLFWDSYRAVTQLEPADYASASHHLAGCMLGRVDGKSPLEYLTPAQQAEMRQTARHALLDGATVDNILERIASCKS